MGSYQVRLWAEPPSRVILGASPVAQQRSLADLVSANDCESLPRLGWRVSESLTPSEGSCAPEKDTRDFGS
ncbi:MAG: hypothetical protein FD138_2821 [Planctomycetota bacterium]|nr:MAG: hypothetical protein FD138_2821 [Planctomycetota bacterium]